MASDPEQAAERKAAFVHRTGKLIGALLDVATARGATAAEFVAAVTCVLANFERRDILRAALDPRIAAVVRCYVVAYGKAAGELVAEPPADAEPLP